MIANAFHATWSPSVEQYRYRHLQNGGSGASEKANKLTILIKSPCSYHKLACRDSLFLFYDNHRAKRKQIKHEIYSTIRINLREFSVNVLKPNASIERQTHGEIRCRGRGGGGNRKIERWVKDGCVWAHIRQHHRINYYQKKALTISYKELSKYSWCACKTKLFSSILCWMVFTVSSFHSVSLGTLFVHSNSYSHSFGAPRFIFAPFSKCAKSSSFFARTTATSNGNRLVPEDFAFYLHIHNGFEGFIAHKIADFKSSFCFYTSWKFSKMTLRRTENWWRIRWNVHESATVCTNLRLPLCLMPIRSLNKTLLLSH